MREYLARMNYRGAVLCIFEEARSFHDVYVTTATTCRQNPRGIIFEKSIFLIIGTLDIASFYHPHIGNV